MNCSIECTIEGITKDHLVNTNTSTYREEEFDCLVSAPSRRERLNIISDGDSWFSFPRKCLIAGEENANIIDHLETMGQYNLLRLAVPGAEAVALGKGAHMRELARMFDKYKDCLQFFLFSAGPNDFVGENDMELYLKNKTGNMTWQDCINSEAFSAKLEEIRTSYQKIWETLQRAAPQCVFITHTYSYPIPNGVGASFCGGFFKTKAWMKPFMDEKGIVNANDQKQIAIYMLDEFSKMLSEFVGGNFIVIDILKEMTEGDWLNEIHLMPAAYERVAQKFHATITAEATKRNWS